jgi:hypothetical protein
MTTHPYLGRRVRFYVPQYGVNVTGTVVRTSGHDITVNNIMPAVPGHEEVTFDETKTPHRMVTFLQTTYSLGGA